MRSRLRPSDLPLTRQDVLYHVGHLNPAYRTRSHSLEGECLSASLCPESWECVARLGGSPTLTLTRPGALFIHAHRTGREEVARACEEAVRDGMMISAPWYRVWSFDGEADDWRTMGFWDHAAALAELDPDDDPDGCPSETGELMDKVDGYRLTPEGERRLGRFPSEPVLCEDAALLLLAHRLAESEPDLCGIYWDELDDIAILSAPRFGILPERLTEFMVSGPEGEMGFDEYARAASSDPAP